MYLCRVVKMLVDNVIFMDRWGIVHVFDVVDGVFS